MVDSRVTASFVAPRVDHYPFSGRWVGGVCLIVGPVLVLSGALLRVQFHFFAPQQLQAFEQHPMLITAAYSAYWLGFVALSLGVLLLVHRIAAWNRTWAFWGGALAGSASSIASSRPASITWRFR